MVRRSTAFVAKRAVKCRMIWNSDLGEGENEERTRRKNRGYRDREEGSERVLYECELRLRLREGR